MTLDAFIQKYDGKKIDFDGAYGGQCVDLFRQYIKEVLGFPQPKGVLGAADFWTNYSTDPALSEHYDKVVNTPNEIPQKGDVMFWNKRAGGGFGHVSVFIEGDVNKFTSFDQNWPTLSKCTKTEHDYKNVLGWFRPKELLPVNDVPCVITSQTKIPQIKGMKVQAILSLINDQERDLKNLQEKISTYTQTVDNLSTENAKLLERIKTLQEQLFIENGTIPDPVISNPTEPITVPQTPVINEGFFTRLGRSLDAAFSRQNG